MKIDRNKITRILTWGAIGLLVFFAEAAAIAKVIAMRQDYPVHMKAASAISLEGLCHPIDFLTQNFYPIWHILTRAAMKFCDENSAATIVTAGLVVITWLTAVLYYRRKYRDEGPDLARAASVALILAGPIYIPAFNEYIILGQGTPNLLHNPTNIMVRAVALPCAIWYASLMSRIGNGERFRIGWAKAAALSLLLLATMLSKPNFMQMFFPAMAVLSVAKLIQHRRDAVWPIATIAATFIPSLLLIALQTWLSFYSPDAAANGTGGIDIAFLKLWSHYSPNVFVSIVLATLFPATILLWTICARKFSTMDALIWLMYLFATVQAMLLIEKGWRCWHGNFMWAYALALFFIWFNAIDKYIGLALAKPAGSECPPSSVWRHTIPTCGAAAVLALHLAGGVLYLWRIYVHGTIF